MTEKRTTIYLNSELKKQLMHYSTNSGKTMKEIINHSVENYLFNRGVISEKILKEGIK